MIYATFVLGYDYDTRESIDATLKFAMDNNFAAANFNPLMAMAADVVILECEELVETGEINPEDVKLPGVFVDYVVRPEEVIL